MLAVESTVLKPDPLLPVVDELKSKLVILEEKQSDLLEKLDSLEEEMRIVNTAVSSGTFRV